MVISYIFTSIFLALLTNAVPQQPRNPPRQPYGQRTSGAPQSQGWVFPDGTTGEDKNKPWSGGNWPQGGSGRPLSGGNWPQGGSKRPPSGGNWPSGRPPSEQSWSQSGGGVKPQSKGLEVLYSWKQIDYTFPNESMRQEMLRSQLFIPKNTLILDVDVYGEGDARKVFITLPRWRPGVPVSLATVSPQRRDNVNLLEPYPNWEIHTSSQLGNCEGITSVFRTHIDPCGRLWVLDSGNNDLFVTGRNRIVCPPQIFIYDLKNRDRLIGRYVMPESVWRNNSLLVSIAIDSRRSDCSDTYAYIADAFEYKMIVFNLQSGQYYRVNSILFLAYPDWSRFNINGGEFDLMGGIFGLAPGPIYRGKRLLYFQSIDSVKQSWVDTTDLRNDSLWKDNMNAKPRAFNLFSGSRSSQSAAVAMDNNGVMFFGLIGSNEIACWNTRHRFEPQNLISIAKDDKTLQFQGGVKIYKDKLYVATNRLQLYANYQLKDDEEMYYILVGDKKQMVKGTRCEINPYDNRFDEQEYQPNTESVKEI